MVSHASCRACTWDIGTLTHFLHDGCSSMSACRSARAAVGAAACRVPLGAREPRLAPMAELGLPPITHPWAPIPQGDHEGFLCRGVGGCVYGDGSGYQQASRALRKATWSVNRRAEAERSVFDGRPKVGGSLASVVPGWFSTVPRGEIWAALMALDNGCIPLKYLGDCRLVIDGCQNAVPPHLLSSKSRNADLWKRIAFQINDHGEGLTLTKTRAHRSRGQAEADISDGLSNWIGNSLVDDCCKELARRLHQQDPRPAKQKEFNKLYSITAEALSFGAHCVLKHALEGSKGGGASKRRRAASAAQADSSQVGGHMVVQRSRGGHQCSTCGLCC